MHVILGAFGRVGRVVARELRGRGLPTLRVTRQIEHGEERDVAVAPLDNRSALGSAFTGAHAAFVLLPDDLGAPGFHATRRRMADSIAGALADQHVPHAVLLSSTLAAFGEDGHGFGKDLAYFERVVRDACERVTILRAPYFQDNVLMALPAAERDGIYPSFFRDRTRPVMTIASVDVGHIAARALTSNGPAEIVDLVGRAYAPSDMARALGEAIGKSLGYVEIDDREAALAQFMSPEAARAMVATLDHLADAALGLQGDRRERGMRSLAETLRAALGRRQEVAA